MSAPRDSKLGQVLDEARPAIEAALTEAERELEELDAKRRELQQLIARTRKMLDAFEPGDTSAPKAPIGAAVTAPVRLTLHEAMRLILTENGNTWMTVHELADDVNGRSLYEKRDRSLVDPSQIHARANKYPRMFEKDGARVRLRAQ